LKIELKNHIELNELLDHKALGKMVCRSIGHDGCVYFLYRSEIYRAVKLSVDWTNGLITDQSIYELGVFDTYLHFVQPIGDDILLVGACSEFNEECAEPNAVIVGKDGEIKSRFCLGDGIECCFVTSDEHIVVAYFDEGIFGNNGWGEVDSPAPLGSAGLVVWDKNGCKLWEHDQSKFFVSHCKSLNISDDGKIYWLGDEGAEYHLCAYDGSAFSNIGSVRGYSGDFLILENGFVFGGDHTHRSYFSYRNRSGECQRFTFEYDGKEIISEKYCFRGNKALLIDMYGRMFCTAVNI